MYASHQISLEFSLSDGCFQDEAILERKSKPSISKGLSYERKAYSQLTDDGSVKQCAHCMLILLLTDHVIRGDFWWDRPRQKILLQAQIIYTKQWQKRSTKAAAATTTTTTA